MTGFWLLLLFVVVLRAFSNFLREQELNGRRLKYLETSLLAENEVRQRLVSKSSPYPEKTVLEVMQENGFVLHDKRTDGAAPREDLLGHIFHTPHHEEATCGHCGIDGILMLYEVVKSRTAVGQYGQCVTYKDAFVCYACNTCGYAEPRHVNPKFEEPRLQFPKGQNLFDVITSMRDHGQLPPKRTDPERDPKRLDARIVALETELNEARLAKARLAHDAGDALPEEPYRGALGAVTVE